MNGRGAKLAALYKFPEKVAFNKSLNCKMLTWVSITTGNRRGLSEHLDNKKNKHSVERDLKFTFYSFIRDLGWRRIKENEHRSNLAFLAIFYIKRYPNEVKPKMSMGGYTYTPQCANFFIMKLYLKNKILIVLFIKLNKYKK